MALDTVAARIVEQGISSQIPDWDLTDDFLQDMDFFDFECGSQDGREDSPAQTWQPAPAELSAQEAHSILANQKCSDTAALEPDSTNGFTSEQRRMYSNRLTQARARKRRKERTKDTEIQLAHVTAQLRDLRNHQEQLEARNSLLEQVARIHQTPMPGDAAVQTPSNADIWQEDLGLQQFTTATERGPSVKLSAYHGQSMTIKEISTMPFEELARVHTVYARKLGQCLLDIATNTDRIAAEANLWQYTTESNVMLMCLAMANPKSFSCFHGLRLDGATGEGNSHLSDAFYTEMLAAIDLTEAQQLDLMHLRRLFYGRLGQLLRERKKLLQGVNTDAKELWAQQPLPGSADIAKQLRANGLAEYRTYMQFASTFFRGIHTCKQHAIAIVYSYPWIAAKHKLLEVLAAQRKQPPIEQYLEGNGVDDMQHALNWKQIDDYLRTLSLDNLTQHVPLQQHKQPAAPNPAATNAFPRNSYDLLI